MGKNRGMEIKNGKRRGEWAEMVFAGRALREGLRLARPWGESSGYDFVVDQDGRMVRVQVKSTIFKEGTGYSCSMKDSKGPYKKNSFEFVAAYVIPEDVWFIIPEKKVRGLWSVGLYPKLKGAKYGEYLEAWDLLRGDGPVVIDRIEACAEEAVFIGVGGLLSGTCGRRWRSETLLAKSARNWGIPPKKQQVPRRRRRCRSGLLGMTEDWIG
ncbi:MAG: group I intron-associated PD-(D/E)XK endonuclease [Candidatus Sulfotelmatobacter sp.]